MDAMLANLRVVSVLLVSTLACGGDKPPSGGEARADVKPGAKPADPPMPKAAPRGPEHAVFSLGDNRLLAHVQRGGGVVALAGSPGFAKYLRFGRPKLQWKLRDKDGDRRVATVTESNGVAELPLTDEQAQAGGSVAVRVSTPAPRRMTILVNQKPAGTVELTAGWQTAKLALPAGAAKAGENVVHLAFAKGPPAMVEWIQLGGEPGGDAAPPLWDAGQKALVLPQGGGLAWYVQIPDKGRLVGDVVGNGCQVMVRARGQEGAPIEGVLGGAGSAVELGALAGKIVRLDLAARGCPEARLSGGALAVPGAAPVVAKPKKPRYVVFWIMDSLRADRVKPFFPEARPEVPTFDRLVGTAAIFRNTYVQGNESRASHASIWTSLYVGLHRYIPGGAKGVEAKWTTLDEAMKSAGLWLSGVSGNGYITKKHGFGDKWDAYRNHIHDGGGVRGEDILKYAVQSVDGKKEPWFLYLGTIDTHVSWRAKEPWISKYDKGYTGKYVKEASGTEVEKMATGKLKISDRDKQRIVAIYDSNVSYQDDLVRQLLDKLKEWGIADETMVVITADHGDEQWEDGRVGHGGSLRESLIRVPLVVAYPPLFPAGIVEEGVDTIDILPTLLDAMGKPVPADMQGESLVGLAQGVGRGYPRPSIASQYEFAHAIRLAGWKVRVAGSGVPLLYHVEKDPYEKKDLAAERPLERRLLTDALSTFLVYQKDWRKTRWGVASNHAPALADDLEK
jgi:arylsulfatase A-like enzyme